MNSQLGLCHDAPALKAWVPILSIGIAILAWDLAVRLAGDTLIPSPLSVVHALIELASTGRLFRYAVASLFRVTWGFSLAVAVGIPLGLVLGWYARGGRTVGPILQFMRPISPLAWIPLSILWFGVGDGAAVFLIFIATVLPLTLTAMNAARNVHAVHVAAARNFGLSSFAILRRVLLPSALPQLVDGIRSALGIAWLVVVAAEMIAVNSGLGFLIVDARNAGDRYDLVVAGMVTIGVIGLGLDTCAAARHRRTTEARHEARGQRPSRCRFRACACSSPSISRSPTANSSACSARRAAASRRCCRSSPASSSRPPARSRSTAGRSPAPIASASSCSRSAACSRG